MCTWYRYLYRLNGCLYRLQGCIDCTTVCRVCCPYIVDSYIHRGVYYQWWLRHWSTSCECNVLSSINPSCARPGGSVEISLTQPHPELAQNASQTSGNSTAPVSLSNETIGFFLLIGNTVCMVSLRTYMVFALV